MRGPVWQRSWFASLLCTLLAEVSVAEWPCWRGPNLDGISPEQGTLTPWTNGLSELWRTNVGTGFSSFALSGGRLYTLGNRDNIDTVYCLEASKGRPLWQHSYPSLLDPNLYEGGPSATPTVDGAVVYTLGKWGDLFCLDAANGTVLWQRQLRDDLGLRLPFWGVASSPRVLSNKLLLNCGGHGLALNKTDGALLWLSNTNENGYGTPMPCEFGGTPAAVFLSHRELVVTSVAEGRLLWSTRWQTLFDMNCPDVLVHNGRFFVTSYQRPGTMLQFQGGGLGTNWQNNQLSTHLSAGVVLSNHLYAFHGDAQRTSAAAFHCLDLLTGSLKWSANGPPAGSVISVAGKLLILSGSGELLLADATPTAFTVRARAPILSGRCWTPPAFSGGILYARNAVGEVVAVQLPFTPAPPPRLDIARGPDARQILLSWPASAPGYELQTAPGLPLLEPWRAVATQAATVGDRRIFTNETQAPAQFYRLHRP